MNGPAAMVGKIAPLCVGEATRKLGCAILLLVLVGCATPQNSSRPPKPATPKPVPVRLDLVGTHQAVSVTLHTIVAPRASDPFVPDARWWDEYTLTVINQSSSVLTVDSATVYDLQDQGHRWNGDPGKLADASREYWRAYQKAGVPVSPKIPDLAGLKFVFFAPFAAEVFGAVYAANPYGFVLTPLFYGAALNDAAKVRRGFAARQLRLPLSLQPGQSVQGSLFFPMTPGPRRFVLQGANDGQPVEIVIPLTSLSTLHLAPPSNDPSGREIPL